MHYIEKMRQMDIFYHSMNYTSKGIIDATYCGAFKRKSAEEANQLIEDWLIATTELHLKLQGAITN